MPEAHTKQDEETGRWKPKATDEDLLAEVEQQEVPTAKSIGEAVDLTTGTTRRRLRDLEDEGRARSTTVGGAYVWQLPDKEDHR